MLKNLLVRSEQEVSSLKNEVEQLRKAQTKWRDEVAAYVYPNFITVHGSYDKACIDAYAAADALEKARDMGIIDSDKFVSTIELNELIKKIPNDATLGETIRKLYKI